ncbi:MAG: ABC transporter ATP-binding protein [Spirochaetes bacterium]|nr:ABC transporter ATP-binding protein [Spirochaetota bacterium]
MIEFDKVTYQYPESEYEVFKEYSIKIPDGFVSLVGPNGAGKSTFLLLCAGLLKPVSGNVFFNKINTNSFTNEIERQKYFSFIYQNMEFETNDNIGKLLEYVYQNGFFENKNTTLIQEIIKELQLDSLLNKKTQQVSKGELQRTIIAFSLLYGSKNILMDEPIFALEEKNKELTMEYITNYASKYHINIIYSLHEIELTRKYSDHVLLFYKNQLTPQIGITEDILVAEKLEKAYQIPYAMLKKKELLYREAL